MPEYERSPVEEILVSRAVSKPRLSDDEGAAILGQHAALIDELEDQEMERFATEVINPLTQAGELVQEARNTLTSDETPNHIEDQTGTAVQATPTFTIPEAPLAAPEEDFVVPAGCNQMFFLEPPYDIAGPTPESTSETQPPWVYKSSSALGIAATGELSLAVGGGRFWEHRYPTPENAIFYNFRKVSAGIAEFINFLSPLVTPTRVDVTVDIRVGLPSILSSSYYFLSPATGQASYGLAGVLGDCHLTLYGGGLSLGGRSTTQERFLSKVRRDDIGTLGFDRRNLRISNTLFLCPGARSIIVVVEARLYALWSHGDVDNPGFAGVDLATPGAAAVVPYLPHNGPLSVTRMGFTFCPQPETICVELLPA